MISQTAQIFNLIKRILIAISGQLRILGLRLLADKKLNSRYPQPIFGLHNRLSARGGEKKSDKRKLNPSTQHVSQPNKRARSPFTWRLGKRPRHPGRAELTRPDRSCVCLNIASYAPAASTFGDAIASIKRAPRFSRRCSTPRNTRPTRQGKSSTLRITRSPRFAKYGDQSCASGFWNPRF